MLVSNRPVEPPAPSWRRGESSLSARRGARSSARCVATNSRKERSGSFLTFGTALAGAAGSSSCATSTGVAVSSPSVDVAQEEEPTPLRYRSVFVSDFHLVRATFETPGACYEGRPLRNGRICFLVKSGEEASFPLRLRRLAPLRERLAARRRSSSAFSGL